MMHGQTQIKSLFLLRYSINHSQQMSCLRNNNASNDCQTATNGINDAVHTVGT